MFELGEEHIYDFIPFWVEKNKADVLDYILEQNHTKLQE